MNTLLIPADAPVTTASGTCRILVADDHPLYREGIVRALQDHGGFEVVAQAADGTEALRLIRELLPDLALLDVRMPELDGVDVVHALALHGPDVPVVMLSAFSDARLIDSAISAGAAGFVAKSEDREVLCQRLSAVAEHLDALTPRRLSPRDVLRHDGQWLPRLTLLEHELLQLAGAGLDRTALAAALDLDEHAVRARSADIARKFDRDSLSGAIAEARRYRLIG